MSLNYSIKTESLWHLQDMFMRIVLLDQHRIETSSTIVSQVNTRSMDLYNSCVCHTTLWTSHNVNPVNEHVQGFLSSLSPQGGSDAFLTFSLSKECVQYRLNTYLDSQANTTPSSVYTSQVFCNLTTYITFHLCAGSAVSVKVTRKEARLLSLRWLCYCVCRVPNCHE